MSPKPARSFLVNLLLALAILPAVVLAAEPTTQPSAEDAEAAYTKMINKRVDGHVKALSLNDPAKEARVHDIIVSHYRQLRNWYDTTGKELAAIDKKLKDAAKANTPADGLARQAEELRTTLKPIHDGFLAKLSSELTPEQVDVVKDEMTYKLVHVTYNAYCDMIQTLTAEQKSRIMEWLIEARETAMDGGSSEQKHAVFGKYKGRINNYLSKEGYDLKKETKDWQDRLKAKRQGAASQPGN
jgi:Spy/CpxP family protein refolding chaperone